MINEKKQNRSNKGQTLPLKNRSMIQYSSINIGAFDLDTQMINSMHSSN